MLNPPSSVPHVCAHLRLSGKGMRCMGGKFRAMFAPGGICDGGNCWLGFISPFITGILGNIPREEKKLTVLYCVLLKVKFKVSLKINKSIWIPHRKNSIVFNINIQYMTGESYCIKNFLQYTNAAHARAQMWAGGCSVNLHIVLN